VIGIDGFLLAEQFVKQTHKTFPSFIIIASRIAANLHI